jgi:multicomponent Na+:H+ antiporter subunit G
MESLVAIVTAVLVLIGSIFALIAAIGIIRLPDVYSRMHAASKAGTVGSGILLITLGLHSMDAGTFARAFAGFVFLLLTAPIAAHLLARASYMAGYGLAAETALNEMPEEPGSATQRSKVVRDILKVEH